MGAPLVKRGCGRHAGSRASEIRNALRLPSVGMPRCKGVLGHPKGCSAVYLGNIYEAICEPDGANTHPRCCWGGVV
jgi:hypothetical protein